MAADIATVCSSPFTESQRSPPRCCSRCHPSAHRSTRAPATSSRSLCPSRGATMRSDSTKPPATTASPVDRRTSSSSSSSSANGRANSGGSPAMAPISVSTRMHLLLYTLAFLAASLWVSSLVSSRVPSAYMDEVFHVPQTQAYCRAEWRRWDDKITTFPGLYASALPYASLMHEAARRIGATTTAHSHGDMAIDGGGGGVRSPEDVQAAEVGERCSIAILRSLNVLYGVLCIPLVFQLLRTLHPRRFGAHPGRLLLATVQLSLFPLSFFFMYLYYTDLASVFWTLAAYLAHQRRWRFIGSTLGVAAVLMRQTNIAWVAFVCLADIIRSWTRGDAELFGEAHAYFAAAGAAIATDDSNNSANAPTATAAGAASGAAAGVVDCGEKESKIARESLVRHHPVCWSSVPRCLCSLVSDCVLSLPELLFRHFGALLTCLSFVVFVRMNGNSIVLGDRDNHSFTPHFPQVLYFITFCAAATAPNWIGVGALRHILATLRRHKALSALIFLAMAAAVHFFTLAHPFLLSDNRHYPFYVWKNLYRRWWWFRYAALPVYLAAGAVMQRAWGSDESQSRLFQLLYWIVTCMCLVPTPLLEPRYFLTPFLIWFLHAAPKLVASGPRAAAAIALYAAVNAATLYVFIFRPFTWNDGTTARFMW